MLIVQISTAHGTKQIFTTDRGLKIDELRDHIQGSIAEDFYIIHNGKIASRDVTCYDGCITIVPRLLGGKGGFGSMLRAIGAQIEKTTNREACRDLSGRRLRDINEEKRLKAWIEKQGKREEEAAERKKKKLQRLCAEPKHEFKDQTYERERSALTERLGDAVEQGFHQVASTSGKRKGDEQECRSKKKKLLLDLDIDSDELDTSDESDRDENKSEESSKSAAESVSNDSGHSSDESKGSVQNTAGAKVREQPKRNSANDESNETDLNISMNEKTVSG